MKISEEAVEAGARAVHELTGVGPWGRLVDHRKDALRLQTREALDAAAPHIHADALEEAASSLVAVTGVRRWLRARAARLREQ